MRRLEFPKLTSYPKSYCIQYNQNKYHWLRNQVVLIESEQEGFRFKINEEALNQVQSLQILKKATGADTISDILKLIKTGQACMIRTQTTYEERIIAKYSDSHFEYVELEGVSSMAGRVLFMTAGDTIFPTGYIVDITKYTKTWEEHIEISL